MARLFAFVRGLLSSAALFVPSHVRWKIVAPYIVLTLMVAAAGTYIATQFATTPLEDRFNNQLAEAARVASDSIVRREREHLSLVRSIAFTVGVPEQTRARQAAALRDLVEPLAANARAEYVEVVGLDGKRILGLRLNDASSLSYETLPAGSDRSDLDVVQRILTGQPDALGDKFTQLVSTSEGEAFYTGGPIRDENGNLAGAVLVGTSLETLLPAMKFEALADITLYDANGAVLGSTFERADENVDLGTGQLTSRSGGLAGIHEVRSVFNRNFDLLYGELRVRDQTVGLFSVALPSSFISSAGATTRWAMTLVFAVSTVAAIGVGLLIARGVTAPLLKLVHAAHAVTEGDLTARSGVASRDEVGELAQSFDVMTERMANQHLSTIRALTTAIDARDPYTAGHSVRVGQLSVEIGRELELPRRDLQYLEIGGYLHDVGKIGIRDNVLLKPGQLTPEERAMIEEHPRIGLDIVQNVDLAREIKDLVIGHHERLDGTGYPMGLEGAGISIFARIGAVADVFDALTTDRPYRKGFTLEESMSILKREVEENHLDDSAVQALIGVLPIWGRRLRAEPALKGFVMRSYRRWSKTSKGQPASA
jgi:putative nucleotidyltransferase with HDIG domain